MDHGSNLFHLKMFELSFSHEVIKALVQVLELQTNVPHVAEDPFPQNQMSFGVLQHFYSLQRVNLQRAHVKWSA